jgi:hypothetical protein
VPDPTPLGGPRWVYKLQHDFVFTMLTGHYPNGEPLSVDEHGVPWYFPRYDPWLDAPAFYQFSIETWDDYDAARAYRNLSIALRAQGLLIPASNYRLREQVLERKARFREFSLLGWAFSWLLNLVAGYGERPVRSFFAYLLELFGFAGAYLAATNGLTWLRHRSHAGAAATVV